MLSSRPRITCGETNADEYNCFYNKNNYCATSIYIFTLTIRIQKKRKTLSPGDREGEVRAERIARIYK